MLSMLLALLLFRQFSPAIGFNILGICPSASYSHQQPFQALMKALAARGHNVTVISTIPSKVSAIFLLFLSLRFSLRFHLVDSQSSFNDISIIRRWLFRVFARHLIDFRSPFSILFPLSHFLSPESENGEILSS